MLIFTLIQFFLILNECKNLYSKEIEVKVGAKIEACCTLKDKKNTLFLFAKSIRLLVLNNDILQPSDWNNFIKEYNDFTYSKKEDTICLSKEQATKEEDNFVLTCTTVLGNYGVTLTTEYLTIKVYEELKFVLTPPSEKVVTVGESISVGCEATGSPGLKVIWRKEGEGVKVSGNSSATLEVKDIIESMNGDNYTCEASINISKSDPGSLMTQQMTLNVLYKPNIIVSIRSFHTDIGVTEVVKLTVTGNPQPILDCRLLNMIATRIITISQPIPNTYVYKVEIGNITKELLGDYNCTATNDKGSDVKTISIILGPENLQIISSNETSYCNYYLLEWTVQSRAKIRVSKITIITYEGEIDSTSTERILDGNEFTPNVVSQGTPENNWLYKLSQPIMNLTSDKLHKITVQMCRQDSSCIEAPTSTFVRTQINNGKNIAVSGSMNPVRSAEQNNNPGGGATNVIARKLLSLAWANTMFLGLLLH